MSNTYYLLIEEKKLKHNIDQIYYEENLRSVHFSMMLLFNILYDENKFVFKKVKNKKLPGIYLNSNIPNNMLIGCKKYITDRYKNFRELDMEGCLEGDKEYYVTKNNDFLISKYFDSVVFNYDTTKYRDIILMLGFNYNIFLKKKNVKYDLYEYIIYLIWNKLFYKSNVENKRNYNPLLKEEFNSKKSEIDLFFKKHWNNSKSYKVCELTPISFFKDCDKAVNVLMNFSKYYKLNKIDSLIQDIFINSFLKDLYVGGKFITTKYLNQTFVQKFYKNYLNTKFTEPKIVTDLPMCHSTSFSNLKKIINTNYILKPGNRDIVSAVYFSNNCRFKNDTVDILVSNKILEKYNYYISPIDNYSYFISILYFNVVDYTLLKGQFSDISAYDKAKKLGYFKKLGITDYSEIVMLSKKDVDISNYILNFRVNSLQQKKELISLGIDSKMIKINKHEKKDIPMLFTIVLASLVQYCYYGEKSSTKIKDIKKFAKNNTRVSDFDLIKNEVCKKLNNVKDDVELKGTLFDILEIFGLGGYINPYIIDNVLKNKKFKL